MRRSVLLAAAAALAGSAACVGSASARYAGPAGSFSAYYYQSPGGVGRAKSASAVAPVAANLGTVPYPRSCGAGRVWRGDRCYRQ
jgi:hypothetical protein